MKQVICSCFFFLFMVYNTVAQKNIFFKKDKPKYNFITKKAEQHKKEQEQFPYRIFLYTSWEQVNKPFSLGMSKTSVSNNSRDALLYIIGLGGSILGSIYADKLHYNYTGELLYPTVNYRQNNY